MADRDNEVAPAASPTAQGGASASSVISVSEGENIDQTQLLNTSLYVGDLADDCTEVILWDNFSQIGPVVTIKICRDSITKKSKGYAYVNYQHPEDAQKALDSMNHLDISTESGSRPCRIMWSDRSQTARKSGVGNLFIKGLPLTHTSKDMEDMFSFYGAILSCKIKLDINTNQSIGQGYVQFTDAQAAEKAISDLNCKIIQGNPISVERFKSKPERDLKTVYCKHYPATWTEADLYGKFVSLGSKANDIQSIWLAMNRLTADHALLGYAVVNFSTHKAAERAIAANNESPTSYVLAANKEKPKSILLLIAWLSEEEKKKMYTQEIRRLEEERRESQMRIAKMVHITGLPEGATGDSIRDHFVTTLNIAENMPRVQLIPGKNAAYVLFSSPELVHRAISTPDSRLFNGQQIIIMRKKSQVLDIQQRPIRQMRDPHATNSKKSDSGFNLDHPQNNTRYYNQRRPTQQIRLPFQIPIPRQRPDGGFNLDLFHTLPLAAQLDGIGEELYARISITDPQRAGKITGMLLEMDVPDLLHLLASPEVLKEKVDEAVEVLELSINDSGNDEGNRTMWLLALPKSAQVAVMIVLVVAAVVLSEARLLLTVFST